MHNYTVIGYYESNGQIFVQHEVAANAMAAMAGAASVAEDPSDYIVVTCIPGHLYETDEDVHFPGESVVDAGTILDQPDVFN